MKQKYSTGQIGVDDEIASLARKYSQPGNEELMRQILTTAIKLYHDQTDQGDLKLINTSLKEMRHAFRIFSRYRKVRKVAIFGSSRSTEEEPEYKMTMKFAEEISKRGFMVITGGGGGVMEAGNRGALKNKSFAINIQLPFEQYPNPYVREKEKLMTFHYFFTRKLIFIKESDATVLFPGGFGTNDEGFEVLTLTQTGKSQPRPIIFVNAPHRTYWKSWFNFLKKEMVKRKFIDKDDLKLFRVVNSVDEAVEEVVNFYRVYHSIRYVGPLAVVRLNKPISDTAVKKLNKEFADILMRGKIVLSDPLSQEVKDKDHLELPRLVMHFDRRNYGRLAEMIRRINSF